MKPPPSMPSGTQRLAGAGKYVRNELTRRFKDDARR